MKKLILLSCSLFCIGPLYAQESIRLLVAYEPETSYAIQYYNLTQSTYTFSGNERFVNSLKSQGVTLPLKSVSESEEHAIMHTQKLKQGKLPFRIDLVKRKSKEQLEGKEAEQQLETKQKNYSKGSIIGGNKIELTHFRGINAKQLNQIIIQQTQDQLFGDAFPLDELQLMDEFTTRIKTTLNLIKDRNFHVQIDKTYQLIKIENDLVYLAYTSMGSIDNVSDTQLKLTSIGSGTFIYNKKTQLIELKEGTNKINLLFEAKEGIITHTENLVSYKEEVHRSNEQ